MSQTTSEVPRPEKKPSPPPAYGDEQAHAGDGHEHGHHEEPGLQHHFDTMEQQFDAGKLGIWAFLVTEVLFFAGLFVAYTIYRAQASEVFVWAHYYLDTNLGALNTVVLLGSSLTAAWAVRCTQLNQQKGLILLILVTIACACTFMVVKYFEYTHKFHDGLVWGGRGEHPVWGLKFNPKHEVWELDRFKHKHPEAAKLGEELRAEQKVKQASAAAPKPEPSPGARTAPGVKPPGTTAAAPETKGVTAERRELGKEAEPLYQAGLITEKGELLRYPKRGHVFFSVYFFMTGLHGFHVVGGIVVWVWLLFRALKGQFGPRYFGPIEYAALYWHLVDLIWIYLFPLLYLIA